MNKHVNLFSHLIYSQIKSKKQLVKDGVQSRTLENKVFFLFSSSSGLSCLLTSMNRLNLSCGVLLKIHIKPSW